MLHSHNLPALGKCLAPCFYYTHLCRPLLLGGWAGLSGVVGCGQVLTEGLRQGDVVGALARALSTSGVAEAGLGAPGQPLYRMPDVSVCPPFRGFLWQGMLRHARGRAI